MASQAVFDAVMVRLEANWELTPITDANGGGRVPARAWVDELRTLFRGQTFAGVTTWGTAPSTTNARSANGAYYELSFRSRTASTSWPDLQPPELP